MNRLNFISKLKALPFVEVIYLFGSRARGNARERSDIDLAIDCPAATQEDWQQVMEIIDNADTLLSIDCVRLDSLRDDKLRQQIELEKKEIYRKGDG